MSRFADLHIHTHFSDGTLSPQEVVEQALRAGLSCISITDHDSVTGVGPAQLAVRDFDLEVIAGIELSSESEGKDIHILGYFVDCLNETFRSELIKIQDTRVERIKKMIFKLKEQGVNNIDFDEVVSLSECRGSLGRPHLALVLKQKGWVATTAEAFKKYLDEDCPAYVKKYKLSPAEAIKLIQKAGGIAVLAHPMITNRDELIPGLVAAGLQGIEVYYPNYSEETVRYYEGIAQKYQLVKTGGSDGHGKAKASTYIGKIKVPYLVVEQLKALKK